MNIKTLKTISQLRRLSRVEIARLAGVSRQAVSLWFKKAGQTSEVSLHSRHLKKLATGLGVHVDDLLHTLPVLEEPTSRKRLETLLLWDHLFSDLESFFVCLVQGDLRALARLVQVFGLFKASKIVGLRVWHRFHAYKIYLRSERRKELEQIWRVQKSLGLI